MIIEQEYFNLSLGEAETKKSTLEFPSYSFVFFCWGFITTQVDYMENFLLQTLVNLVFCE